MSLTNCATRLYTFLQLDIGKYTVKEDDWKTSKKTYIQTSSASADKSANKNQAVMPPGELETQNLKTASL